MANCPRPDPALLGKTQPPTNTVRHAEHALLLSPSQGLPPEEDAEANGFPGIPATHPRSAANPFASFVAPKRGMGVREGNAWRQGAGGKGTGGRGSAVARLERSREKGTRRRRETAERPCPAFPVSLLPHGLRQGLEIGRSPGLPGVLLGGLRADVPAFPGQCAAGNGSIPLEGRAFCKGQTKKISLMLFMRNANRDRRAGDGERACAFPTPIPMPEGRRIGRF